MLDEEAAAKFSTAAALAAKEKRSQMAKANYDKGLLTAIDQDEKAREVSSHRGVFVTWIDALLELELSPGTGNTLGVKDKEAVQEWLEPDA